MIERAPILDREKFDRDDTDKELEKIGPFDPRYLAARNQVWTIIKGCIGSNNKLNIQIKRFNTTTDGRGAYFALEEFLLGNDHTSSLIRAAEKGLRETTFTTNVRNWRIEDYITKHIKFFSVLADQAALGHHPGMFEKGRVGLLLDGLKNKSISAVKSNIMCQPQLYNEFNATTTHLKNVVNCMPELQTAPGRQVSDMGRGWGRDRDGRGGRGFDSGHGRGGHSNDRGRRGNRVSSSTTFSPETCPEQDAIDRAKPNIVHRYVTGNRIFVDDNTYRNLMDATEIHAVLQIRDDLRANKDPLGRNNRKRTYEVAALQRSMRELSARVDNFPDNRSEDDRGRGKYPDEAEIRSNKNQPGLILQSYSEKKHKGIGD